MSSRYKHFKYVVFFWPMVSKTWWGFFGSRKTNSVLFHHFIHVNTDLIHKIIKPKQSGLQTFPLLSCTNHHDSHLKIETYYAVYLLYINITWRLIALTWLNRLIKCHRFRKIIFPPSPTWIYLLTTNPPNILLFKCSVARLQSKIKTKWENGTKQIKKKKTQWEGVCGVSQKKEMSVSHRQDKL